MTQGAAEIAAAVRSGAVTAVEVTRAALDRIDLHNESLNAFTAVFAERALKEAANIDASRHAGAPLGPLAGVPYSVKNLFDVEGETTLAGAAVNRTRPPATSDALLVTRMRDAGAVLVGSVNMDEHAYGFTTENTHFGATRNPLDRSLSAGGSSGGSAAAVAGQLVPLSLGSDTNGSIRVPASFCGIFGLKPTYGRIPRTGSYPFVHSLDHLGPFARSTEDLALCYDALQGPDAHDPACVQRAIEPLSTSSIDASTLRIGALGGYFDDLAKPVARDALALVGRTLNVTRTLEWKSASKARAAAFVVTCSEGGALHAPGLRSRYDEYEPLSRDRLVAGTLVPTPWYLAAQKWRSRCRSDLLDLFKHVDVLIAPATPFCAQPLGTEWIELNGRRLPARPSIGLLAQPISCVGFPVCVVPVWRDQNGTRDLPIGVQIIAAPWREDRCLAVAKVLEANGLATARLPPP
jgi:AtzE family amidohydrolase